MRTTIALVLGSVALAFASGCSAGSGGGDQTGSSAEDISRSNISNIALANVGKGACSRNSEGGNDFDSSCTGNGGQPEYWCADFARWVWAAAGGGHERSRCRGGKLLHVRRKSRNAPQHAVGR